MTPAQRAYEPAASDARALRRLSTELTRVAGGQVDAEGVGTYADAPLNRGDKGTRADQVLVAGSREVLDRAIAEMVRRGYSVLGVREDDGEWWAWLAGAPAVGAPAVGAVPGAVGATNPIARMAKALGALTYVGKVDRKALDRFFDGLRRFAFALPAAAELARSPIRGHAGPGPPGFRASAFTPYAVASSDPVDALCGFVWEGVGDG